MKTTIREELQRTHISSLHFPDRPTIWVDEVIDIAPSETQPRRFWTVTDGSAQEFLTPDEARAYLTSLVR